ncbi:MAG TPA: MFS transporter [Porticoccaceae bacterium]|mgnify:CR=1 FL=1|jgi:MFS family permease|nr:MFS transporter [Porticoccaceae bacterium]
MLFKSNRISVLLSGICALILSMGIARYSFTPMLPIMQAQLGVSESLAGWLAGWHYIGYIVGLFIVWLITDLRTKDFFYRYGLLVSVIATAFMAALEHSLIWYVSRFFAGITSATSFMLGTGLILNWLNHNGYKSELGLHFTGIGIGIMVSAIIVDMSGLDTWFNFNWRMQWIALALVGGSLMFPAMLLLPRPKEREMEMSRDKDIGIGSVIKVPPVRWLVLMQCAYFCAGFSNTINVTFTSLITELQPLDGLGAKMWLLVGIAATPAPLIWDRLARRIGRLNALSWAYVLNIMGNICLAMTNSVETTAIAAILFGITFMGIVSLTLSTIGHLYGFKATQVMARLTFFYCIAQILSPILAGTVAELSGSFTMPLFVVSIIMLLGLIFLLTARRYSPDQTASGSIRL